LDSTEEGKKVTRNKGDKFMKVFRRIKSKVDIWTHLGIECPPEFMIKETNVDKVDKELSMTPEDTKHLMEVDQGEVPLLM
jgi:hypothetical protein